MFNGTIARGVVGAATAAGLVCQTCAAHAHHPGGLSNALGAGPINTISATPLEQGQSVAGVTLDYTSFDNLSDATLFAAAEAGIEDVHGLATIQNYGLVYSYGLTNDLMVSIRLPYVRRTGIREVEHHHGDAGGAHQDDGEEEIVNLGNPSGISDLSLLGQYRFLNDKASNVEAAVLLGIKTPTGKTNEKYGDETLEAEFQPGSGSWDPLFGLAMTHRTGPWSFDASILYALATEGTQETDLGDLFLYSAAVSYRLSGLRSEPSPMFHGTHSHKPGDDGHGHTHTESTRTALDLVLELNGEWHDKQETAGEVDANSGGSALFVSPGLRLSVDNWSSYATVGIPVVADYNGIQSEPDWRISAGSSVAF